MKKISALAIAGVFTASLAATAFAEMAEVKVGGEIRVRMNSVDTEDMSTKRFNEQRTRVNVDAKINETTKAYISLQDSRVWGSEIVGASNSGTDLASGDNTVSTGREVDDSGIPGQAVDVSQAWFQLDKLANQPLSLRVGRQVLAYGDQRLIGGLEWSNSARRFDAIKLMYNTDAFSVDLWTAKVVEGLDSKADSDFNGLYATLKTIPNNTIDLYLLQDKNDVDEKDVKTYGARLDGKVAGLDYTGEFALQSGDFNDTADQDAMAFAIRAGYTIPEAMGLRIGAEYAYASGDDDPVDNEAFLNLYPTNHSLYGYTDDITWSNIKAWSINASVKPTDALTVKAEYWNYTLAEDNAVGDDDAGSEINLLAKYALNANVDIEAAIARRIAGDDNIAKDYLGNVIIDGDNTSDYMYLMANVKF